jgi:hypothetical protein
MNELERRMRKWRIERLRALGIEGAVRSGSLLALYVLALLVLDRYAYLPQQWRWALFFVGVCGLLYGVYHHFVRPLGLLRAERLLNGVASLQPELAAYLRSAWELARQGVPPHTSPELAAAHMRRTEELVAQLPDTPVFRTRTSHGARRRMTVALFAWSLGAPWAYYGNANFQRILSPWKDVPLEAMITIAPGHQKVAWAAPATVRVRWEAQPAGALRLWVRDRERLWKSVPWERDDKGEYRYRVDSVTADFVYQVRFKRMRSRAYKVQPVPYPHFKTLVARVRLPGRSEEDGDEIELGGGSEISALRRSWVTLRGRPDQELASAQLRVTYLNKAVPMKPLPSGEWEGGFPLNEDATLHLELLGRDGFTDPTPVSWALRALDDAQPEVELLSPAFELEISPQERLTVTYEAADDYGLSSLALVYSVDGGGARVRPLESYKKPPEKSLNDFSWDLSAFPVGTKISFRIRAQDNHRPRAQTAVSNEGLLRIVDFASAHAVTQRQWLGGEESLKRLAASEGQIKELYEKLAQLAQAAPESATPEMREALERAGDAEQALEKRWDSATKEMQAFAKSMKEDAYANPGMTQAAQMLAQALKSLKENELRRAREAAAKKDFSKAGADHQRLQRNVQKAAEILSAGREMQAMQDFWGEAHRMDRAGSEISKALDDIAKSGKAPSAEQQQQLNSALGKLQAQMNELQQTIRSLPKADPDSKTAKNRKVYRVPLEEARRTASSLQDAIARGDYETAARLAKQLARQLAQVRKAVAQAAQSHEQGGAQQMAERMERAKKMWDDVVEQQARAMGMTQKIEDAQTAKRMQAQKRLLDELAEEQRGVLRDAGLLGRTVTPVILRAMKAVLGEFSARRVEQAPGLLNNIALGLKARILRFPPINGIATKESLELLGLAKREEEILEKLRRGAPPPGMGGTEMGEMMAAGAVQRQTTRKTESLHTELQDVAKAQGGILPGEVQDSLDAAQAEQSSSEAAFNQRRPGAAVAHQQRALEHLEKGRQGLQKALQKQRQMMQSQTSPFSQSRGVARPFGPRGRAGSDTGFVPLPGAEEYQPPREIRQEVEKSLQERRPEAFDDTVNDYLKRMSR